MGDYKNFFILFYFILFFLTVPGHCISHYWKFFSEKQLYSYSIVPNCRGVKLQILGKNPQVYLIIIPSKHLLVFKTSWRCLQDMSWRRLQHVFSVTIFRLPRRLEDFFKTSTHLTVTCLKLTVETLEKGVKYGQS